MVLFLRIQHERKFVALLHHPHQAGVLALSAAAHALCSALGILISRKQFRPQDGQGLGKVLFVQHGKCRNKDQQCKNDRNNSLFHINC